MRTITKASAALLLAAALTGPALAGEYGENTRQISVDFASAELTSAAGMARIERNVRRAAELVCSEATSHSRFRARQERECEAEAVEEAMTQLDARLAEGRGANQYARLEQ